MRRSNGIRGALGPQQVGTGQGVDRGGVVGEVDLTHDHPPARLHRLEHGERSVVGVRRRHHRATVGHEVEHGSHGGHAGGVRRRHAAFERTDSRLEHLPGRVPVAAVANRRHLRGRSRPCTIGGFVGPSGCRGGRPAATAMVAGERGASGGSVMRPSITTHGCHERGGSVGADARPADERTTAGRVNRAPPTTGGRRLRRSQHRACRLVRVRRQRAGRHRPRRLRRRAHRHLPRRALGARCRRAGQARHHRRSTAAG